MHTYMHCFYELAFSSKLKLFFFLLLGMMPIQSYSSFQKMTRFCKTRVPPNIWNDLAAIKDDDEEVKSYGVQLCVNMCRTLSNALI